MPAMRSYFSRYDLEGQLYVVLQRGTDGKKGKTLLARSSLSSIQWRPVVMPGRLLLSLALGFFSLALQWSLHEEWEREGEQPDQEVYHPGINFLSLLSLVLLVLALISCRKRRLVLVAHSGERYIHLPRGCLRGSPSQDADALFQWFRGQDPSHPSATPVPVPVVPAVLPTVPSYSHPSAWAAQQAQQAQQPRPLSSHSPQDGSAPAAGGEQGPAPSPSPLSQEAAYRPPGLQLRPLPGNAYMQLQ